MGTKLVKVALEDVLAFDNIGSTCEEIEEGEFTPVISKKSKKLSKLSAKAKDKPDNRKPAPKRVPSLKGAKHHSSK